MLNKIIILTISLIAVFSIILPQSTAAPDSKATLWIPDTMLRNQEYYGMILLDGNTDSNSTFNIITDNEEAIDILSDSVVIPKDKHHGLFKMKTKGTGEAKVFAIYKDSLLSDDVRIVESAAAPIKLDLILPSRLVDVLADQNKNTGYIFLLNDFDDPVPAKTSIDIDLTRNGDVSLQRERITIEPGSHYAKFFFEAGGDGTITASAPNLEPDEETISTSEVEEIELRLAVAPNPIPTSEHGEIYYWLERGGKPYLPPHDVMITISISDSAHLSFNDAVEGSIVLSDKTTERQTNDPDAKKIITVPKIQLEEDSRKELVLKAGTYYGRTRVYSSFDSAGGITISGLAKSINPNEDEEVIKESATITASTAKSNSEIITKTRVFAYPDPAYDKVEIIVSGESDQGLAIEDEDTSVTVFSNNVLDVGLDKSIIKQDDNYAILEAAVKTVGTADIFAEIEEAKNDQVTIATEGRFIRDSDIDIVTFPVIFGVEQDLFLITSTHDKIRTIADSSVNGTLVSITSRPSFDFVATKESESVIAVKGTVSNLLEDEPNIYVASNADTVTDRLDVYNPDRKRIELIRPDAVFPKEPFPITSHIMDLSNNPIQIADLKISSSVNITKTGDLFYINQTGKHDLIFYEKNTVPEKTSINVKGATPPPQIVNVNNQQKIQRAITYDIVVKNGQGSGTYKEDEEVTISAPPVIDDMFIIKKKLVGWKNISNTEPVVTFLADEDLETEPIYQEDYTMLFALAGSGGGIGGVIFMKKRKKNKTNNSNSEEDDILQDLLTR